MAENGVDIAKAYVHLIPSLQGGQGAIAEAIVPSATKAGDEAGAAAGGRFSKQFKTGLGALGAAAATTGAFVGLWKIAETFDDVGDTIRIGTGATGEALEGLVDVAKNVGKTIPNEFGDIGTAVADINTRMGLTGDTLQTVASQYLQAGNILGEAVDVGKTSAAFNAFKIEGDDVSKSMDHLFQVSQATGIGMNDLAAQVSANAPAVQALGFSFDETAVLVGSLDKAGLNSSAVMASMSKGLVTLAKDGEQPKEAFARVTDELGVFIESGDEAAALDLASQIFGTRGASQFVGALQSGAINMDDLGKAAGQTSDTILGTADDTADFAESWQLVKNNAMLALEPLASNIFGEISTALAGVLPHLETFGVWLGDNTWVLGVAAGIIGVTLVAAFVAWAASIWAANAALLANPIVLIILAIVALVAGIVFLATQTTFFQDVWANVWGFIQDTMTNVGNFIGTALTWIGDTWAAVWGAVSTFAIDTWNNIVGFITGAINMVKLIIQVAILAIQMTWTAIWTFISTVAANVWSGIVWFITAYINTVLLIISTVISTIQTIWTNSWNFISSVAAAVWAGIVWFITSYINMVLLIISTVISTIQTVWSSVWGAVSSVASSVWGSIIGTVETAINEVQRVVSAVLETIKSAWSSGWDVVSSTASNAWNGIMGFFSGAVATVSGVFSGIADAISTPFRNAFNGIASFWNSTVGQISFKIPDWVPGVGGNGWSVPNIPMLAEGGVITKPTLAVVGEAGPEAVIPLSKLSQHLPEGRGTTGPAVVQNIHPAPGMSEETIGRVAANSLDYQLRMANA